MSFTGDSVSISADPSKCTQCKTCETICPNHVFHWEGDRIVTDNPGRCILCGHCVAVCPEGALMHSRMPREQFAKIGPDSRIPEETLEALFAMRRSCRRFKPEPLPNEMIDKLMTFSKLAPTGTNSQNVRYVLIDDPKEIETLGKHCANYYLKLQKQLTNPLTRFAIRMAVGKRTVNTYRFHLPTLTQKFEAVLKGDEKLFHGAPAVLIAYASGLGHLVAANCNLAAMQIMLGAEAMGLGTCYNGYLLTAMIRDKQVKVVAGIPKNHTPGAVIAVGYPDVEFHLSPPKRRPRITKSGM
jgi:nitroreductase/NAD-dependent dihydropyrimidine dehydrogenase PreA subunit